jgi:FlaA1/EpsC-like NDP-sugar epimerase
VIPSLNAIRWHEFLARPRLPSAGPEILDGLRDLKILITGAGGSIASALALRLASLGAQLILLESSESNLFALRRDFELHGCAADLTFILGSVADSSLLDEIFSVDAPRLVFHAAAFKQVPLLEEQPFAAISNNVFGTADLTATAPAHRARVVLLSTDKAVEPASVMGTTKRIAEHIVLNVGGTVLRLGNVLASRDCVAEVFAQQIRVGGPVTVTHPDARRYFLTIEEAVDLLLLAATEQRRPALLAPDIQAPQFIADLAQFMARTLAPGRDVSIVFTCPRAGDKESERLWSSTETASSAATRGLCLIESRALDPRALEQMLGALRAALEARDLAAALDLLRALVPDYTPSATVRDLAAAASTKVPHE